MYTVHGVCIEIIEVFEESALIQEIESKEIYLIDFDDFDMDDSVRYNNNSDTNNVISLYGWKDKWQKKLKQQQKEENQKLPKQKRQKFKKPLLLLS